MNGLLRFGLPVVMAFLLLAKSDIAVDGAEKSQETTNAIKLDHSSPQAVAESFRKASQRKDWKSVFACATKRAQMSFLSGFFLTEPGKPAQAALQGILKRHGIDPRKPPKPGTDPLSNVNAKVALFGDLAGWAEKNLPRKPGDGPNTIADLFSKIAFKNFRIKGDTATAEIVVERKSARLPRVEFRRIDKMWYVHFDFVTAALIDRATLDIRGIQSALELYAIDHTGRLLKSPKASQQALLSLTNSEKLPSGVTLKPYLSKRLKDPWGNVYYYQYPHPKFPKGNRPGIWSAGPDGKSGTKDDITNWDVKRN